MEDILQTFKISGFEIDRDSKISQRFLAACTRFQRVAGPSIQGVSNFSFSGYKQEVYELKSFKV